MKYTQQFINLLKENGINESDPDFNKKAEGFVGHRNTELEDRRESHVSKKVYEHFPSEWELRGSENGQ